jgi:hypothetical protein
LISSVWRRMSLAIAAATSGSCVASNSGMEMSYPAVQSSGFKASRRLSIDF